MPPSQPVYGRLYNQQGKSQSVSKFLSFAIQRLLSTTHGRSFSTKNIPFLVFRGAHNWHKNLVYPPLKFQFKSTESILNRFTAAFFSGDLGSSVPQQVGEELSFSSCILHITTMEPFDAPPSEIGLPPTVSIELLL